MSTHLFVDTDVLIDFLADRHPFAEEAAALMLLAYKKRVTIYTSILILINTHYQLKKINSEQAVRDKLKNITAYIQILPLAFNHLQVAFDSPFADFEDAVQNAVAESANQITGIVTRNVKDHKHSSLKVYTPAQFLKTLPA